MKRTLRLFNAKATILSVCWPRFSLCFPTVLSAVDQAAAAQQCARVTASGMHVFTEHNSDDEQRHNINQRHHEAAAQLHPRPRTAHAASNASPVRPKSAARPSTAARPQSARAGELLSGRQQHGPWLPAGIQRPTSSADLPRPATAPVSRHATLARLKAELAAVAAGGNMQLQSLTPSTVPVDASAELQAQVMKGNAGLLSCASRGFRAVCSHPKL
jgi:hypothetical protein